MTKNKLIDNIIEHEIEMTKTRQELIDNIIEHIIDTPNFSGGIDGSDREELIELLNELFYLGKENFKTEFKNHLDLMLKEENWDERFKSW